MYMSFTLWTGTPQLEQVPNASSKNPRILRTSCALSKVTGVTDTTPHLNRTHTHPPTLPHSPFQYKYAKYIFPYSYTTSGGTHSDWLNHLDI